MKRFIILPSLLAMLFLVGCNSEHTEHSEHEEHGGHHGGNQTYVATSPIKMDTTVQKEYVCQIKAIQHIEIRALEKGYLQEIYVDEGQAIRKGQNMFKIMPLMYQAELQKAQAELLTEKAEVNFVGIEYQNTKTLCDSNIVSKNELALAKAKLDKAKAELNQAEAKLELAKVHLGFTEIKAPFSGIMDRFEVRLGSLVEEGDMLTVLSDNSQVWAYFNVPEAEYLDYKMNSPQGQRMKVDLEMANNQMFEYHGIVETIEADFNNETGNIAFRATFPNSKGLLRHGETGNIIATVRLKDAIIIPQKATFEILEKKYVFVIGKDDVVKQVEIDIEAEMPDLYIIRKGLKAEDKILLEGIRKVKDNQHIKYTYEDPKEVMAGLKVYVE